jgi:hypothetical protein
MALVYLINKPQVFNMLVFNMTPIISRIWFQNCLQTW